MTRRMFCSAAGVAVGVVVAAAACNKAFIAPDTIAFAAATLNAAAELPPVAAAGSGAATFRRPGEGLKYVDYLVNITGMTGITKMHLHRGRATENGPAILTLYDAAATGAINGVFRETNFAASELTPAIGIDSLQKLIQAGLIYINVHTAAHPDGEIRGQLRLP